MNKALFLLLCINFLAISALPAQSACVGQQGQLRWFYWNNISSSYTTDGLYKHIYYPQTPDGMQVLTRPESPFRFNDYFGSSLRGYLKVPTTGSYVFNLRGDDDGDFFLSTDDTPANKSKQAYFTQATHSNYEAQPTQTSEPIVLNRNRYYYFEINHVERGGRDFVNLSWKTPASPNTWEIVASGSVYDYTCETRCEPLGTPCNDGDANTTNDQQDGFCNCFGEQVQTNNCVGERGSITALYYDNLAGRKLAVLDTAVIYPDQPTRAERRTFFKGPSSMSSNYATRVRAFLTIPMDGDYTFNLTGDDETVLKWTGSDDPNAATTDLCHIPNWTDIDDHDKFLTQTSVTLSLKKGDLYYLDLVGKEASGDDHYAVWWKTPFYADDEWRIIQGTFLYNYACETACLPAGTPCNDNDESTFDDVADTNCGCAGTPCGLPDCSTAPTYQSYELCNVTDRHSNETVDSWLSCSPAPNPNSMRGTGHWIMYDFNEKYQLYDTYVWNYNAASKTNRGFQQVAVDYSQDGIVWQQLGTYTWGRATGVEDYAGFSGPDFGGITAQYVVITALSNYGNSTCSGFSELALTARPCQPAGTACDDFNAGTNNDQFNANCECVGTTTGALAVHLLSLTANWKNTDVLVEWQVENETAGTYYEVQRSLDARTFEAIGLLRGTAKNRVETYQLVDTKGANLANELYYRIKTLENDGAASLSHTVTVERPGNTKALRINDLLPNPFRDQLVVAFSTPTAATVQLQIFDVRGQLIKTVLNRSIEKGAYQYSWDGKDNSGSGVPEGIYYLQLTDGKQRIARKVVKG